MTDKPVIVTELSVIKIGGTGIYRRFLVFQGISKFLFMTFLSLKKGTIVVEFRIRDFPEMASAGLCVIIRECPPARPVQDLVVRGYRGLIFHQAEGDRDRPFYLHPLPPTP
jgi:hypothetical protein